MDGYCRSEAIVVKGKWFQIPEIFVDCTMYWTCLDLVFFPVPHVMEQGDHSDQSSRAQSCAHRFT